ncbi:hypothetical protein [Thomasclavelia cocleata]|uniref:hypothetical protein n=1 Tax=Thomasclavelia cocleata TaxID=69824 RepID=UPI00256EF317|nr:hypothetical protein [Thomasclavelia cocleata]
MRYHPLLEKFTEEILNSLNEIPVIGETGTEIITIKKVFFGIEPYFLNSKRSMMADRLIIDNRGVRFFIELDIYSDQMSSKNAERLKEAKEHNMNVICYRGKNIMHAGLTNSEKKAWIKREIVAGSFFYVNKAVPIDVDWKGSNIKVLDFNPHFSPLCAQMVTVEGEKFYVFKNSKATSKKIEKQKRILNIDEYHIAGSEEVDISFLK